MGEGATKQANELSAQVVDELGQRLGDFYETVLAVGSNSEAFQMFQTTLRMGILWLAAYYMERVSTEQAAEDVVEAPTCIH